MVLMIEIKASACPLTVYSLVEETQISEGHIRQSRSPHLYNGNKSPYLPRRCAARLKRDNV